MNYGKKMNLNAEFESKNAKWKQFNGEKIAP